MQVVFVKQVVNSVDRPRPCIHRLFSQLGQLPILGVLGRREPHTPEPLHAFPGQHALAIHPQQFAQHVGVATIGLVLLTLFGLNQHDLAASELLEHLQQPVVETANLHNRYKTTFRLCLFAKILEKPPHLLPLDTHLSPHQHVTCFVP